MASLPVPDLSAPSYWERQYGIATFEEFQSQVSPAFAWLVIPQLRQAAVTAAYHGTASPEFALAVAWSARNLSPEPPSVPGSAVVDACQQALSPSIGAPMSQLIVADCFQVQIKGKAGTQDVINVVGVENSTGTAAGAAAAVQTAWKVANGPLSRLSAYYALQSFTAVDISSSNGAIAVVNDTSTGGVNSSHAFATAGACALIKWNGGTRSKSSRGRLYFGPIMEQNIDTDGRTVVSGSLTGFNTAFDNFRSSLSSSGYPLVVLSRTLSQAFTVSSSSCEAIIATQRRRIRG